MDHSTSFQNWAANIAGVAAIVGSALGWVPIIGAVAAVIWYGINIYESQTVQRWLATRRIQKIAVLKAKILILEARTALPPPPAK